MTRSLEFLFRETTELMRVCIYTEIVIKMFDWVCFYEMFITFHVVFVTYSTSIGSWP
jgi:hypothetical protein